MLEQGISEETHLKLKKLFEDIIILEHELEESRKNQIQEIDGRVIFGLIDKKGYGYASLSDYMEFFRDHYCGELPFSSDDINYLFNRHDKFKYGKVTMNDFLGELEPLRPSD